METNVTRGVPVRLDGMTIPAGHTFENCPLTYGGGDLVGGPCKFVDCSIQLDGAALNTIRLLGELYRNGMGSIVEEVLAVIRAHAIEVPPKNELS